MDSIEFQLTSVKQDLLDITEDFNTLLKVNYFDTPKELLDLLNRIRKARDYIVLNDSSAEQETVCECISDEGQYQDENDVWICDECNKPI